VNRLIRDCCRAAGVFVNDAVGEAGDVIVPSVVQGDGYLIAISTFGRAPTLPRFMREHLEETFPHMEDMVRLQEHLRHELKGHGVPWKQRAAILHAVLRDAEVWRALAQGEAAAAVLARGRYLHG
jgi:precorrin-2 dehydrogenase/sirohydrochlorin ferrochelatase